MLNYRDELIDKQAAVAAITERLAKPVGESGGYATKQERFAKQKRLQSLWRRVGWLEGRVEVGHVSVVRGGKRLLNLRNNLEAADIDAPQWRDRWDAARWFIAADGDSQYQWGNGLICVDADTGEVSVTLPAALRHLANAPRGRVRARPRCGVQPPRSGVGGSGRDRGGVLRVDLRSRQGVLVPRRFVAARTNRGAEPAPTAITAHPGRGPQRRPHRGLGRHTRRQPHRRSDHHHL